MSTLIGQTVSHYKILEQLGGGGMGIVYKAQDLKLHRPVALKFLSPELTRDPEAKQRFVHEAQAASALDHPNICNIHDIGHTDDGQMFIVMASYEGQTLKKKIEQGPLDIDLALDIAIQVGEGLSRAHEAGIVHRDIKPANIFITSHDEAKILDFGLAKLAGQTFLTKSGTTLGTAAYMSPEQARGEAVDHRTDIWSLGIVLYEMLSGRRPFESDYEQALVYSILNESPKPLRRNRREVPEVVEQIVQKMMPKNPEVRYQTVAELLSDLEIARGKEAPGGTIAAAQAIEEQRRKKLTRRVILAGVAATALVIGIFVVIPLVKDQALALSPRAIAFTSLENRTGDPSLDYLRNVLPDVLGTTLGDSKYIRVTSSDRMRELMKQVGKDTATYIDRETGLLLCRKAAIDVMCAGSYTKAGPLFLAQLELIDVSTGERLGNPMKARGREVESLLKEDGIADDLAKQISGGMGVSQLSTQATVRPVAEVSSGSIEAQRFYQRGKREYDRYSFRDARTQFELAVKEDSTFSMAWFFLRVVCNRLQDRPAAERAMTHLRKHAAKATERERFQIASAVTDLRAELLGPGPWDPLSFGKARVERFPHDAEFRKIYSDYLATVGRTTEATVEAEKAAQLDPAYAKAWNALAYLYARQGRGEEALHTLERYAELQPGDHNPFHSRAECLWILGRIDEAIPQCERALQVKPDFENAAITLAKLHFMNEDYEESIRWADRAFGIAPTPSARAECIWWRAYYLFWVGRLKEVEPSLRSAERITSPEQDPGLFPRISWLRGWLAYEKGDLKGARALLSTWARTYPATGENDLLREFTFGILDLWQRRVDSIESRSRRMHEIFVDASEKQPERAHLLEAYCSYFANALTGAYLLAMDRPDEIRPNWIEPLWHTLHPDSQAAASWPVNVPTPASTADPTAILWVPIPFDVLPRAYVERRMIDSAIVLYELTLRKPFHVLGPSIPRYYYRLARLYEQTGTRLKAMENYARFLKAWRKADPIYKEPADAKTRLAKLKRG